MVPIPSPIVYPYPDYQPPVRPSPLSDEAAASFQSSRSQFPPESATDLVPLVYYPARSPPEIAPESNAISGG